MNTDLTKGSVFKNLIRFSLPYLLSCFLQSFYGLADMFVTGMYNKSDTITAVSVGSQVTHMLTLVIVGIAMGGTVMISRAVGAKDYELRNKATGNTISLFVVVACILTAALLSCTGLIVKALSVPDESISQTKDYLKICFLGVPFITAYNVIASIFRGMGDSKRPMYFVGAAGIINVGLDFLLIGGLKMGAMGAALATVSAQALSVVIALVFLYKTKYVKIKRADLKMDSKISGSILKVGIPIAVQDACIQIAFLIITKIANSRGVEVAAAVGIVEKIISFIFLVPSAMLSTISAVAAQNAGAGLHDRGRKALNMGLLICIALGGVFVLVGELFTEGIVGLFSKGEPLVIEYGTQYLRTYVWDVVFAGIHFCYSGYFFAYQKSMVSFLHNMAAIVLIRIPGAYYTSWKYPDTLAPMGLAAPLGSILSALICIAFYFFWQRKEKYGSSNQK